MKFKFLTIIFAAMFIMFGCQSNNTDTEEGRGNDSTFEQTRYNDDLNDNGNVTRKSRDNNTNNLTEKLSDRNRNSNNRSSNNRHDKYDVSEKAAERIVDEIAEIDRAYVLTTNNNAYVAAQLDEDNETPKDNIAKNDRDNNSTGTNIRQTNDRNAKDRTVNEGDSNKRKQDNHMSNRRDREGHEVTDNVKNQIADIVQDEDGNIENVYVTSSPDFMNLADDYVTDMNNGKPIRGFFDQIGNTIERIFPQNKR